eukprot:TRINITY_DN80419_c0_g1_i1.p1 TRINITY_DN80419_c0_g1~~TRINITY_DN80419_c0_g1_i1.p1  ORF type:complete len:596 (-),score=82.97 TRINITY_DN80419_c0_g1_i1:217-2004(-)
MAQTMTMMVPPPPTLPTDIAAAVGKRKKKPKRPQGGEEQVALLQSEDIPFCMPVPVGKSKGIPSDTPQMDWMIHKFKTMPCRVQVSASSHDHRCCPYYHSDRDKRRVVFAADSSLAYLGEPCPNRFDDSRACAMGDACGSCHSTAELLYHPDLFKKRLCHQFRRCPRGKYCAFAHARQELLVPNFTELEETEPTEEFIAHRFKTQWCPIGGPHDWESCVYAHTYRDWRRAPILGYSSHPCPRWSNSIVRGSPELEYENRCPHGFACPLSHGAKEQLYHPHFYKTSPCSDPNCRRGPLCAFTHGEEDAGKFKNEDNAAKVARKPIPEAEQILSQYQPTYATPPMYHALEDAPKAGNTKAKRNRGGGRGVGRERENSGSILSTTASESYDAPTLSSMPVAPQGFPSNEVLYTAPYPPYMWMPMATGNSVPTQMPDTPQMFWSTQPQLPPHAYGMPPMMTHQMEQLTLPMSPASTAQSAAATMNGLEVSPQNMIAASRPRDFFMPEVPQMQDLSAMSSQNFVDLSAWRNQKCPLLQAPGSSKVREGSTGWRTLSSFGSMPPSAGQSQTTTPRTQEKPDSTVSTGESNPSSGGGHQPRI